MLDDFLKTGINLQVPACQYIRTEPNRSKKVSKIDENHQLHGGQSRIGGLINIMNVLVIDIGGTHVKILATGHDVRREFDSGPGLTPKMLLAGVRKLVTDWPYDVITIGYPGPVVGNRPFADPWNLGKGWAGFNFEAAFKCPVKVINDAAMQALGSYKRGKMLFLGLGTGLGTALVIEGLVAPMELGHLPYKNATFEDYVGIRGLNKFGKKKWRKLVADTVKRLAAALEPDEVVLGGGNARNLKVLPPLCRLGDNYNAFAGGFRLWEQDGKFRASATAKRQRTKPKRKPAKVAGRTKPKTI